MKDVCECIPLNYKKKSKKPSFQHFPINFGEYTFFFSKCISLLFVFNF